MLVGALVQLEEAVVHVLLQLQGVLDGLQHRPPLSLGGRVYTLGVHHEFSMNAYISTL